MIGNPGLNGFVFTNSLEFPDAFLIPNPLSCLVRFDATHASLDERLASE
jgi:hypothetical protein